MSRSPANAPLVRSVPRSIWVAISNSIRLQALLGTVLGSIFCTGLAHAQNFPSKTVRLIVPFAAGGPTDIAARLLADQLSKTWGQTVVVDARPGGGSVIGSAAVAQAPADGYTLLFGPSSALVENSLLMRELPYDPIKGFAPVAEIYQISAGLSVNSKVPATSVKELVDLARVKSLSYSSFGIGMGSAFPARNFQEGGQRRYPTCSLQGECPGARGGGQWRSRYDGCGPWHGAASRGIGCAPSARRCR